MQRFLAQHSDKIAPMTIQVCINGREYLARRPDRAGIGYEKRDNCFVRIDDVAKAQRMISYQPSGRSL